MGVTTWPMVELEADDALASAAHLAARDPRVEKVCIWTPDKDLAQCVIGDRVVQIDRRSGEIRDDARRPGEVRRRAAVHPRLSRARRRCGRRLSRHSRVSARRRRRASSTSTATSNSFPRACWATTATRALLFKTLATLRTDAPLFDDVEQLRWKGATGGISSGRREAR